MNYKGFKIKRTKDGLYMTVYPSDVFFACNLKTAKKHIDFYIYEQTQIK